MQTLTPGLDTGLPQSFTSRPKLGVLLPYPEEPASCTSRPRGVFPSPKSSPHLRNGQSSRLRKRHQGKPGSWWEKSPANRQNQLVQLRHSGRTHMDSHCLTYGLTEMSPLVRIYTRASSKCMKSIRLGSITRGAPELPCTDPWYATQDWLVLRPQPPRCHVNVERLGRACLHDSDCSSGGLITNLAITKSSTSPGPSTAPRIKKTQIMYP